MAEVSIRTARPGDEVAIHRLLHALAVYEKLTADFTLTPGIVARDMIGPESRCRCALAVFDDATVGIATWYPTYSTFGAARGLYLEDFFVDPQHRGHGVGRLLFRHLAECARAEGASHIGWSVLDWNALAVGFYETLGAQPVEGWKIYRLSGRKLDELLAT